MKKILTLSICGILLTACDNYPYKKDIQEIYDWNNETGDKAICMMAGRVTKSMYPYTTIHLKGEELPFSTQTMKEFHNRLKNENLHLFSKRGFFTEEYLGEVDGKPIYRYNLTDLGRKYVKWTFGNTNFCFGRVVVDKIKRTKDTINGVGGGTVRDVYITYHVENIPDWVKDPEIYKRFRYFEKLVNGEPVQGMHSYKVFGKNKLETLNGVSGVYQWASDVDEELEE